MNERIEDLPDLRAETRRAVKRHADKQLPNLIVTRGDGVPLPDQDAAVAEFKRQCLEGAAKDDPTFDIRRKQANLCEAVMVRVFDLEAQAAALTETAKKLRAAVLANT